MAFVVTARHAGGPLSTSAQTLATNSTTPTASSLLLVFGGKQSDNDGTASSWQTPTGGSLTYTQIAVTSDFAWAGDGAYLCSAGSWRAPVSGSPSAHTVTVDAYSGANLAWYNALCCDITGHDTTTPIVQSKPGGANLGTVGDSHSGTVTLDAAPAAGNLVLVYFASGNDVSQAYASPTAGDGKTFTQLHNQAGTFCHGGLWYRIWDGTESNTITCSDVGDSVGNYSSIAVEVAAAAGGGTDVLGAAALTGDGTLTTAGRLDVKGAAALSGVATKTVAGKVEVRGSTPLDAIASLSVLGRGDVYGSLLLAADLTMQISSGVPQHLGSAVLTADGGLSVAGRAEVYGLVAFTGEATADIRGQVVVPEWRLIAPRITEDFQIRRSLTTSKTRELTVFGDDATLYTSEEGAIPEGGDDYGAIPFGTKYIFYGGHDNRTTDPIFKALWEAHGFTTEVIT